MSEPPKRKREAKALEKEKKKEIKVKEKKPTARKRGRSVKKSAIVEPILINAKKSVTRGQKKLNV